MDLRQAIQLDNFFWWETFYKCITNIIFRTVTQVCAQISAYSRKANTNNYYSKLVSYHYYHYFFEKSILYFSCLVD